MTLTPISEATSELARWVSVLAPARQLAEVLADTDFVPKGMRGKPDAVCAAIMYGDELGLGPMQSLAGLDVVEGKPRPSAELARALILRDGHSMAVHEMTGHKCRVSGLRAGRPESERLYVEWTVDMARAAGLLGKSNWRSYPRAMLLARATSDLARLLFPDVVKGLGYIAEDSDSATTLESWAPETEEPPVAPPVKRPQRARRPQLPNPGHHIATEERPGPDGSVDVPLPAGPDYPAPELPPERPEPASEPEAPPAPIRPGKLKALQTMLSAVLGSSAPPEERHEVLGAIVGHPVESSKNLTQPEADTALDTLHRIESGQLELVTGDGGQTYRVELPNDAVPLSDPWSQDTPLPDPDA